MNKDIADYNKRDESKVLMLCATLGLFGAHLFYLGHYALGIIRYILSTFFLWLLVSLEINLFYYLGPEPYARVEFGIILNACMIPAVIIGVLGFLTVIEFVIIYRNGDKYVKEFEAKRYGKVSLRSKLPTLISLVNTLCMAFGVILLVAAFVLPICVMILCD